MQPSANRSPRGQTACMMLACTVHAKRGSACVLPDPNKHCKAAYLNYKSHVSGACKNLPLGEDFTVLALLCKLSRGTERFSKF